MLPESGPTGLPPTYTVNFPIAGNFKLVCLVHADMTGVVHVSNPGTPLPYDQNYYSQMAVSEELRLLAQATALGFLGTLGPQEQTVGAGIGQILNMTGLGSQTASLMRFLRQTIRVRVGETVEWSNLDPSINHTVTFGTEPIDPRLASSGVLVSSDGARQATISSTSASVNSGFLSPTPQDRANLTQAPLAVPRFRVTFTAPGTYNYICAVHDQLGMSGTVIVY
jgi:plastocyanin